MKTLAAFIIVLVGVVVWQYTKISDLNEQVAAANKQISLLEERLRPRPQAPKPTPKPTSDVQHVICPLCHGLQVVLYNGGRNKDNCPLCVIGSMPVGYRDVRVDADHKLCPNCGGMGKITVDPKSHPPRTESCVLCAGIGVVLK